MIREKSKFYYPRELEIVKERPGKEQKRTVRQLKREMESIQREMEHLPEGDPEIGRLQETLQAGRDLLNLYGTEQKPQRRFRAKYKNCSVKKAYRLVSEYLASHKDQKFVTKEELSRLFQIPESRVEDAFRILNREGVLSQAVHQMAHDINRNPTAYGTISGWASDIYYIYTNDKN